MWIFLTIPNALRDFDYETLIIQSTAQAPAVKLLLLLTTVVTRSYCISVCM